MPPKIKSYFYTPEELKKIKEQWLKDKARIDSDIAFGYIYDEDREYQRHLNNINLQMLFKHAARVFRDIQHEKEFFLYPGEEGKIIRIYRGIVANGFFSHSKIEEKAARGHLGKICSRQSFIRYRKGKYHYKK